MFFGIEYYGFISLLGFFASANEFSTENYDAGFDSNDESDRELYDSSDSDDSSDSEEEDDSEEENDDGSEKDEDDAEKGF